MGCWTPRMISVSGGLDTSQSLSSVNHMAALLFAGWLDSFSLQPCTKQATSKRETSPVSQQWVAFMYYWFFFLSLLTATSVHLMRLNEIMEFLTHFLNIVFLHIIVFLLSAWKVLGMDLLILLLNICYSPLGFILIEFSFSPVDLWVSKLYKHLLMLKLYATFLYCNICTQAVNYLLYNYPSISCAATWELVPDDIGWEAG